VSIHFKTEAEDTMEEGSGPDLVVDFEGADEEEVDAEQAKKEEDAEC
jgi:hypothetical protein